MFIPELLHFFILPIIIGLIGGFSAYLFRIFIQFFSYQYDKIDAIGSIDFYLLSMPLLFYLSHITINNFLRDRANVTIDEIAKKISLLSGRFSFIKGFLVLLFTSLSIGFGVPIGREGPIAKLGGLLSEVFLLTVKTQRINMPIYLSAGVSSAIAATFNAPIAGVIFGIEIIIGRINSYIIIPLVVACATSTMVAREFIGDYTAFYVPPLHYSDAYFKYMPLAGIFFALIALVLTFSLKRMRKLRYKYRYKWKYIIVFIGFFVGVLIVLEPQIKGVGYEYINQIFSAGYKSDTAFEIMASKLLAIILSIGSGIFGGMMSPSIFIGAFGGYWLGGEISHFQTAIDPRVFALVGSAAMLSGVSRAPLRSAVIITELTHSYQMLLPILITSSIAAYIVAKSESGSYFKRGLLQRGIDIEDPGVLNFFNTCKLENYLDKIEPIKPNDVLNKILRRFRKAHSNYLPVVDEENKLIGILSLRDVRKSRLIRTKKRKALKVSNLMSKRPFAISDQSVKEDLYKAISILNADHVPYVKPDGTYVGMININKLLKSMTLHQQGYRIKGFFR